MYVCLNARHDFGGSAGRRMGVEREGVGFGWNLGMRLRFVGGGGFWDGLGG